MENNMTREEFIKKAVHSYVPGALIDPLWRWVNNCCLPGDFLQAVLRNDLTDAVCRADENNLLYIKEIVKFVYNELPGVCCGSDAKIKKWAIDASKR